MKKKNLRRVATILEGINSCKWIHDNDKKKASLLLNKVIEDEGLWNRVKTGGGSRGSIKITDKPSEVLRCLFVWKELLLDGMGPKFWKEIYNMLIRSGL